jgi:hypothetical protein
MDEEQVSRTDEEEEEKVSRKSCAFQQRRHGAS